jgi:hypothetical protein
MTSSTPCIIRDRISGSRSRARWITPDEAEMEDWRGSLFDEVALREELPPQATPTLTRMAGGSNFPPLSSVSNRSTPVAKENAILALARHCPNFLEELLQRQPFPGRLRMQRKRRVLHADGEVLNEPIHTHGAEVTPRSDVVGEGFQSNVVRRHSAGSSNVYRKV